MKTIHKLIFSPGRFNSFSLHAGFTVTKVHLQGEGTSETLCMWVLQDLTAPKYDVCFKTLATGGSTSEEWELVGTFGTDNYKHVFHVFQMPEGGGEA